MYTKLFPRAVALYAAGDRKLLAFESQRGSRKFLRKDRVRARDVVAISGEPELLPRGPSGLYEIDRRRERDDFGGWELLFQHRKPKIMIGMGMGDVDGGQILF